MNKDEVLRRAQKFLGYRCLERRMFMDALRVYEAAGAWAKLIALGDRCLEPGLLDEALEAYAAAGAEAPKDKLIALGDHFRGWVWPGNAVLAYEAAGMEAPKDLLISCGELCLIAGKKELAPRAYELTVQL